MGQECAGPPRLDRRLGDNGVDVVVGTRPTVEAGGSRRNEAFTYTGHTNGPTAIRQKSYLPDEPGFWEHSWHDRGPRRFDAARAGMPCSEYRSAPSCGSWNGPATPPPSASTSWRRPGRHLGARSASGSPAVESMLSVPVPTRSRRTSDYRRRPRQQTVAVWVGSSTRTAKSSQPHRRRRPAQR